MFVSKKKYVELEWELAEVSVDLTITEALLEAALDELATYKTKRTPAKKTTTKKVTK